MENLQPQLFSFIHSYIMIAALYSLLNKEKKTLKMYTLHPHVLNEKHALSKIIIKPKKYNKNTIE